MSLTIDDAEKAYYEEVLGNPDGYWTIQDLRLAYYLAGLDGAIPFVDTDDLEDGYVPIWDAGESKWVPGAQTGGEGGEAAWGSITGTLSDQTDLQNALDAKAASSTLGTAAVEDVEAFATAAQGAKADTAAQPADLTVVPANTQTANYTLTLTDAGKAVEMNNSSARTITVPPNSSVAFPVGTVIEVYRMGTGTVTLVAGSGVTIRTVGGLAITAQYGTASIRKRATNEWVAAGAL